MEPLRIEWKLTSDWVPPHHGLHLDGLIALAVVRDSLSSSYQGEGVDYAKLISDLPFERFDSTPSEATRTEQTWCWKASMIEVIGYHGQSRRYLTAKTPVDAMAQAIVDGVVEAKGGAYIDTLRGPAKNSALFYTVEYAERLQAWCIGDKDALEDLLGRIDAIGVKSRIGHGSLIPFEDGRLFKITPDPEAATRWQHRNLPVKLHERLYPGIATLQPPYWNGAKCYCWKPIDEPTPA